MKYRIKVKTQLSGKSYYYIQQRFFWFIWTNLTNLIGYEFYQYVVYESLEEAQEFIQGMINSIKQQKIIKTEIINYGNNII